MAKQRGGFIEGCVANNIDADLAGNIFDLVEKFAGYGFNKSHSAAYGLVSYQTAWLKTHYPAPFMAAVLSADMHNTDKVVVLVEEVRSMKLRLDAPDVNFSDFKFTVNNDGRIVYGLGAIKGVGEGPVEAIVEPVPKAVPSRTCSISVNASTSNGSTNVPLMRWCAVARWTALARTSMTRSRPTTPTSTSTGQPCCRRWARPSRQPSRPHTPLTVAMSTCSAACSTRQMSMCMPTTARCASSPSRSV